MFGDTLRDCPADLWEKPLWAEKPKNGMPAGFSSFWYLSYHTLFWLDLYLTGAEEGFEPPAPFDLTEMEEDGPLPRVYSLTELLDYLAYCRNRCQATIRALTPEQAQRLCRFSWGELSFAELQIYSLRHVQEHGAQLRLFLGQQAGRYAEWEPKAREE